MAGVSHQASCVVIDGRALMIEGAPGSGKSALALALIDRGAGLIGDDGVTLTVRAGRLIAAPPPHVAGLIEVRNLGLLPVALFPPAPVALVLRLDGQAPRFVEHADRVVRAGVEVPSLRLTPHDPLQAIKAEWALRRFGAAG